MSYTKEQALALLQSMQTASVATIKGERPAVRPMTLMWHYRRFFLATGTEDDKVRQVKNNPLCEISIVIPTPEGSHSLRLAGRLIFATRDEKTEIFNAYNWLADYFEQPDSPNYTLLEFLPKELEYMPAGQVTMSFFEL